MPNVTLSMDKGLLARARRYAETHHTSLNQLIRDLVRRTVDGGYGEGDWLDDWLALGDGLDRSAAANAGRGWTRDELYDARIRRVAEP